MAIPFNTECLQCNLRRQLETVRKLGNEKQAMAFAKEMMKIYLDGPEDVGSPWFSPQITDLMTRMYGLEKDRFREEKEQSNAFVLARMDRLRQTAEQAPDPVLAGLKLAILGNYIDFSALQGEVSFDTLDGMLDRAMKMELDMDVYAVLCRELEAGKNLLYLTDNAGEIGFDRILAEEIRKKYPRLAITFCVRGDTAINDATRADAQAVGLPFKVIDNGNRIPGTQIDLLGREAREALDTADVILAKGQGNAETLLGCGYNIYYAFLIKCVRFMDYFGKPKMTPMLVREKNL